MSLLVVRRIGGECNDNMSNGYMKERKKTKKSNNLNDLQFYMYNTISCRRLAYTREHVCLILKDCSGM